MTIHQYYKVKLDILWYLIGRNIRLKGFVYIHHVNISKLFIVLFKV